MPALSKAMTISFPKASFLNSCCGMMVYNLNNTHFFMGYCNWKRIGWKDDACLPITIDVTASHVEKKLTPEKQ